MIRIISRSKRYISSFPILNHENPLGLPKTQNSTPLKLNKGLPVKQTIENVNKIVLVSSGKGGVGKSTIAVNLAAGLKQLGKKVGVLDADIFGPSIPTLLKLSGEPRLSNEGKLLPLINYGIQSMSMGYLIGSNTPVVWRGLMVMKAIQQLLFDVKWDNLDILIVDMPPGTGDVQLSISQQLKIDGSVIVSTPQDIALIDVIKGIKMFEKVNIPIFGIVENMSYYECPNCHHESYIFGKELNNRAKDLGIDIIGKIPLNPEVSTKSDEGIPLIFSSSNEHLKSSYLQIAKTVDNLLFQS
ncbi:hypothetical protein WICMUC_005323 [Wickerhamomyces mucosus]|uniref:Iron-sulfur protein IND1 n=1 Tax=Wickerhamomyces mucosus TaxID=1378264 RepID=A0A9P8T726_9ASCO|nr:hypothetical protein WICMUC_005323 [Wickerhamomyces mucosus]